MTESYYNWVRKDAVKATRLNSAFNTDGSMKVPAFKPTADSVTAFQFKDAAGNVDVNYDSTNGRLGIGNAAPTVALDVTGSGLISGTLTVQSGITGALTGNVIGNVTGNCSGTSANITAYTINQSVGTADDVVHKSLRTTGDLVVNGVATAGWASTFNASGTHNTLGVRGADDSYALDFRGSTSTGKSFGLYTQAGTNASDVAMLITNVAVNSDYLKVRGDGVVTMSGSLGVTGAITGASICTDATNVWDLNGFTGQNVAPNGYITVVIGSTTYQIPAKST
jgi:hypothetical protein